MFHETPENGKYLTQIVLILAFKVIRLVGEDTLPWVSYNIQVI